MTAGSQKYGKQNAENYVHNELPGNPLKILVNANNIFRKVSTINNKTNGLYNLQRQRIH